MSDGPWHGWHWSQQPAALPEDRLWWVPPASHEADPELTIEVGLARSQGSTAIAAGLLARRHDGRRVALRDLHRIPVIGWVGRAEQFMSPWTPVTSGTLSDPRRPGRRSHPEAHWEQVRETWARAVGVDPRRPVLTFIGLWAAAHPGQAAPASSTVRRWLGRAL